MIQQIEDQAGIKFKIIGVPQAEDVIKASSKVILKNLELVNSDVIPFFTEAAKVNFFVLMITSAIYFLMLWRSRKSTLQGIGLHFRAL